MQLSEIIHPQQAAQLVVKIEKSAQNYELTGDAQKLIAMLQCYYLDGYGVLFGIQKAIMWQRQK